MSDKKIAYITSQFPALTETFILREIEEARKRGVDIQVFSLKGVDKDKLIENGLGGYIQDTHYSANIFSAKSLKPLIFFLQRKFKTLIDIIFEIIITHISNPLYLLKALISIPKALAIAKELRERNIDKIHAHWATIPATAAWAISKLNECEYTFTAHAWDIYKIDIMLEEKIRDARKVITCTKFNKSYLTQKYSRIESDKIEAIYHGLDLKRFTHGKREESSTFRILSIGRMVQKKGFDYLLRACANLAENNIPFVCNVIYVKGNFGKEIFKLHKELKLEKYVNFITEMPQEKVVQYYYKSDCFVLPSIISDSGDRDGIPNVILEAFATGLPVVSTDVSGIPEVVINNETGLLVKPNDPQKLTEAIEKLYTDIDLREKLGSSGKTLVNEQFQISSNVERLLKYIM